MTTQEIIGQLKKQRQSNTTQTKSGYKNKLQDIRKRLAVNALKVTPDSELYKQLMNELKETKLLLKQVSVRC